MGSPRTVYRARRPRQIRKIGEFCFKGCCDRLTSSLLACLSDSNAGSAGYEFSASRSSCGDALSQDQNRLGTASELFICALWRYQVAITRRENDRPQALAEHFRMHVNQTERCGNKNCTRAAAMGRSKLSCQSQQRTLAARRPRRTTSPAPKVSRTRPVLR